MTIKHKTPAALLALPLAFAAAAVYIALSGSAPEPVALVASTACDPSVVTTSPDGRGGVAVFVHNMGAGVVTVDATSNIRRDHRVVQQQITKRGVGAQLALSGLDATSLTVSIRNRGTCDAPIPRVNW